MQIAALLFDKLTVLDIIGPAEVLSWLPDAELVYVGKAIGPVRAAPAGVQLVVEHRLDQVTAPDILVIPGGPGVRPLVKDSAVVDWVRAVHGRTRWTTSVCTGSLLLGAAGLLKGMPATTHWNAADMLGDYGARYVPERVVRQDRIVTAAGVSSGIDMALALLSWISGPALAKSVQLAIEYDPAPPFDCGVPAKASPETVEQSRETLRRVVSTALS